MSVIQIDIAASHVKGEMTVVDQNGISVSIIHPYEGLSARRYVAPLEEQSPQPEPIEDMARDLLIDLYRVGSFIEEHLSDIIPCFLEAQERIEHINPKLANQRYERDWKQMIEKIGQGRVGVNEYKWQLQSMRETKNLVDDLIRSIKDEFFNRCFPFNVPYDLRSEVFEYLKSKARAQA